MSTIEVVAHDDFIDSASFEALAGNPKANTAFEYMYRDASNWKQFGRVIFSGAISRDDVEAVLKARYDGEWFIPGQIGMVDLQEGWDPQYDHPFHELGGFELTLEDPCDRTVSDFVKSFTTVKWKKRYKP